MFQIGLICSRPPISASTPVTIAKNAPLFTANTGTMRMPMTFCSVRPGPGNWVCFWYHTSARCAAISARMMPGNSSTCAM